MIRQGDILIVKVNNYAGHELDTQVIQEGEVTGHAHRLAEPESGTLFGAGDVPEFIVVKSVAEVVHEEHYPITLEKGIYRIIRQREYSPQAIRWVQD